VRTSTFGLAVCAAVLLPGLFPFTASAQKEPEAVVARSLQVLSEVTRNPKTGMPRLVLRNAQGIAIIPDMFKMSFIFGARFGRGVLVVRQPDGSWSNPIFIRLLGGSFGAQAGAQSTDLVLVFQSPKGLDRFLTGKDKLTIGVDVAAAAGPVGKRFEASTDAALKAEILSYSNTQGLFAGVSAEGASLMIDWRADNVYYRQPVSPAAILGINSALAVPQSTIALQQMLAEKTAWPERIARGRKVRTAPVVVDGEVPWLDDEDRMPGDRSIRAEPLPGPAGPRPRSAPKPEVRPQAEPGDIDDLDEIPPPTRRKPPAQAKPRPRNDEDLPEAAPARPKTQRTPEPKSTDDDAPDLDAPKSASNGRARSGATP
jgi:lipid-binding SYLF domain-containing protein